MAVYMVEESERERQPLATPIPYKGMARELFGASQIVIPFLGAGASLVSSPPSDPKPLTAPERQKVANACTAADVVQPGPSRRFLEAAIRVAWHIQQSEQASAGIAEQDPFERVKGSASAPSARDLAEVFAGLASFDYFQRAAREMKKRLPDQADDDLELLKRAFLAAASVSGVTSPTPPLLSAASYFNYTQKEGAVWRRLTELFQNKIQPTKTHRLVAAAAWHYMQAPGTPYLIVTTNYDCLMEKALDDVTVPYCVLTVDKKERKVHTRLSASVRNYLQTGYDVLVQYAQSRTYAGAFHLYSSKPLVILYKMHGCVDASEAGFDSIVLSDADYVAFIRNNGPQNDMIPAFLKPLMAANAFWFFGYSFSDWNVRALFEALAENNVLRTESPTKGADYAVMLSVDPYEVGFFQEKQKINICKTSLDQFADNLWQQAPAAARNCPMHP